MCGVYDPRESDDTVYMSGHGYFRSGILYMTPISNTTRSQFQYSRDENGDCNLDLTNSNWMTLPPDYDRFYGKICFPTHNVSADDIGIRNTGFQGPADALFDSGAISITGSGSATLCLRADVPPNDGTRYGDYRKQEWTATGSFSASYDGSADESCVTGPPSSSGTTYSMSTVNIPWSLEHQAWRAVTTLTRETVRDCFGSSNFTNTYPVIFSGRGDIHENDLDDATGSEEKTRFDSSDVDTEEDALAVATTTTGSQCSSIYQKRTNNLNFIKQTVKYTLKTERTVKGQKYKGCVRFRKRESYSGSTPEGADTQWKYDVEPDEIAVFTADPDEDGFEEIATEVELPNEKGYEYQVLGANIWVSHIDCECPETKCHE